MPCHPGGLAQLVERLAHNDFRDRSGLCENQSGAKREDSQF